MGDDTSDDEARAFPGSFNAKLARELLSRATTPPSAAQLAIDDRNCHGPPVLARAWQFADPYFWRLRKHLTLVDTSHDEDAPDWRLNLDIPCEQVSFNAMARQGVVLQTMLARADHAAWMRALLEITELELPPSVHVGDDDTLQPRFAFTFGSDLHSDDYMWRRFVKVLFRQRYRTSDFMYDYSTAYQAMTASGFDMATMEPIPVKLRFAPEYCGYSRQVVILKNIMHVIAKSQSVEARWKRSRQWRACPEIQAPPVLHVDSIDLDLREFTVHPSVLNTLEKLVASAGVRISSLTLPGRVHDGVVEATQLRSAWATLMCTVLGIKGGRVSSQVEGTEIPGADRLVVPSPYMDAEYYLPFFMAARDARGTKAVRLEMGDILKRRQSHHDQYLGAMLGYAFFSKHSTSSITSLEIDQMIFTDHTIAALQTVTSADDPLKQVYLEVADATASEFAMCGQPISLKSGTPLTPCWGAASTKTPAPWTGTIVNDESENTTVTVYLPGFGLCDIDRSRLPNKKRRTTPSVVSTPEPALEATPGSTQLRHLSLFLRIYDDTDDARGNLVLPPSQAVVTLGNLVGHNLTSLKFRSEYTTEATVVQILENFKKLQSLSLIDAKIEDLSGLLLAYNQGCQISSLDLTGCQIPMVVFKSLLRWLSTDEKVKGTLRRLRFGKNWNSAFFTQLTVTALENMLKANKELTHLYISIPEEVEMWDAVSDFQGEALETTSRTVVVDAPPPPPPVDEEPIELQIMREMWGDDDPRVLASVARHAKRPRRYRY